MTSCWAEKTLPPPSVPAPAVRSAPAAMVLSAAKAFCVQACQSGSWLPVVMPTALTGSPMWAASCVAAIWNMAAAGLPAARPASAGSAT